MTDSSVNIGAKPLGAVAQDEEDDAEEFLGFLVFSTTGEAEVPREWLVEKWDQYNLPKQLIPDTPSNWSAYRRAMRNLIEPENKEFQLYNEEYDYRHDVKLQLDKSEEVGSNTFILYARVFWPEELIGEEGGDWKDTRIARFQYHNPEEGPGGMLTTREVEEGDVFYEKAGDMINRGRELYKRYQTHLIDSDLQKTLRLMREEIGNAVPIRRSVYFFGAHHQELVEGVSEVWKKMNRFKDGGEDMRVDFTPVVNLQSQRELVAERAEEMVRDVVDEILEQTVQSWDEDETADEIARDLMEQLGESGLGEAVSEYNALLQTRLSVKEALKEQANDLSEQQEEVVEKVLDQKKLSDQ